MLSIRLSRTGKRKQPLYRLIITEKSQDPWGTYLENLGTYNPRTNPATINFKVDRIKDWIAKGAQCTETVWNLLIDQKVVEGEKRKVAKISTRRKEVMAKRSEEKAAKAEKAATKKAAEAAEAATAVKTAEPEAATAAEDVPVEDSTPAASAEAPATDAPAPEEKATE